MSARLLDGNVLIALAVADHVHHSVARAWWLEAPDRFATTPMTQGTLLRFLLREGLSVSSALGVLDGLTGSEHHEFWPDDAAVHPSGGARRHGPPPGHRRLPGRAGAAGTTGGWSPSTPGLAAVHPDVAELLHA